MIIYSCITNGYDEIPDHYYDPDVKYVMYYDGEIEKKGPWEFIHCDREEPNWIKAYYPKCMSHTLFDEPHVWIDGCYKMPPNFVEKSKEFLQNELTLQDHPIPRNIVQEFVKLFRVGFATQDELVTLAQDMMHAGFDPKQYRQSLNCCIWRQNTERVREWNYVYWNWYKNHCQRVDQITSSIADQMVMKSERVPIQIDWHTSTRKKNYNETYTMHVNCGGDMQVEFRDTIKTIFNLRNNPLDTGEEIDGQLIVYTCITNGYDEFPEQSYYDPDVRYVCFHDGTIDTTVGPWEYIELDLDIEDPRDYAFYVKANAHEYFPKNSYTVWIDGCFVLTKDFIKNSMKSFPFSVLRHGGNFSYYDEMLEGFTCAFFKYDDAINLTRVLDKCGYNFKNYSSPQCTILWRKLTDEIEEFNKEWYMWGNQNYNRDNIPFDAAIQNTGIEPKFYENRDESGIDLGFNNKVGRRRLHPQNGDLDQYERQEEFLSDLRKITKLHPKVYAKYDNHEFYMRVFGIIDRQRKEGSSTPAIFSS